MDNKPSHQEPWFKTVMTTNKRGNPCWTVIPNVLTLVTLIAAWRKGQIAWSGKRPVELGNPIYSETEANRLAQELNEEAERINHRMMQEPISNALRFEV